MDLEVIRNLGHSHHIAIYRLIHVMSGWANSKLARFGGSIGLGSLNSPSSFLSAGARLRPRFWFTEQAPGQGSITRTSPRNGYRLLLRLDRAFREKVWS